MSMFRASSTEKREISHEEESVIFRDSKKQKTEDFNVTESSGLGGDELESVYALASLATLSSRPINDIQRDGKILTVPNDESGSISPDESRSPEDEPVPISPEARTQTGVETPKKVTFAPNTMDYRRTDARRFSIPPRIQKTSKMPPAFARTSSRYLGQHHRNYFQKTHPVMSLYSNFVSQSTPHIHQEQKDESQHQIASGKRWICDFCNIASFPSYQEACAHEETCRFHSYSLSNRNVWHPFMMPVNIDSREQIFQSNEQEAHREVEKKAPLPSDEARKWHYGVSTLFIPAKDPEWLTELNCFIRSKCVEAFSAEENDMFKATKRGRISLGQVGIRCVFCKHRPVDDREPGSVSYPSSTSGIYESVKRWQRVHTDHCKDIPQEVKEKLKSLANSQVWIPTTRQYWSDSARAIGMVDTHDGIRFDTDPAAGADLKKFQTSSGEAGEDNNTIPDGELLVKVEDADQVPEYVYFLMSQVESCHFTESDRFVARSKGIVGYPGFQCRFCKGHAGLGKYFPLSAKSLATNSTSQNIHAHLLKCRKCPIKIKSELVELKEEKSITPRLESGWRRVFFDKIWLRLHGS